MMFTDVEGSTRIARRLGDGWPAVLDRHRAIARTTFEERGGRVAGLEGDSFFVLFDDPVDAVAAAHAVQVALDHASWPADGRIRIRIGLHAGAVAHRDDDDIVGPEVHRAARIAAAAHGGQVIVSEAIRELVADRLPDSLGLRALGRFRLKDFDEPQAIYQLTGPDLDRDFPPIRLTALDPTNLPAQATTFIGREVDLRDVIDLTRQARLVTLVGPGGIGKTRLLVEVGAALLERAPDGVWLVELGTLSDPSFVPGAVARAVRLPDDPGRSIVDTVTDFLREKSIVLLVDNCEHLVDAVAPFLDRLLGVCPGLGVVATSREALDLAGEVVFEVPALAVGAEPRTRPDGSRAEHPGAAVQLFLDRAHAARSSFVASDHDLEVIAEICRRLDGIPLAIELAASRVAMMSVDEIAAGLGERFRLLVAGRRTALPRQQTLQALFDWSWDLLSEADRRLLARLSVFAGGWTAAAAAYVTDPDAIAPEEWVVADPGRSTIEVLDGLARLVHRSLVVAEIGSPTRYRLLETVRDYAARRAAEDGETDMLRERHLRFYLALATSIEPGLRGPEMVSLLRRLDPEIDNLRVALDTAFATDPERTLLLSFAMSSYWRSRASWSEHLVRLAAAASLAMDRTSSGPSPADGNALLEVRILAAAARAHAVYGDLAAARLWSDRGLELIEGSGDIFATTDIVAARGIVAVFGGEADDQRGLIAEIGRLAVESGDLWVVAVNLGGAALADMIAGDVTEAQAKLEAATDAAAATGNPYAIAFVALSRGRVAGFMGRTEEARRSFGEAIDAFTEMGDERFALVAESDLAHALRQCGALDEAEVMYRRDAPSMGPARESRGHREPARVVRLPRPRAPRPDAGGPPVGRRREDPRAGRRRDAAAREGPVRGRARAAPDGARDDRSRSSVGGRPSAVGR